MAVSGHANGLGQQLAGDSLADAEEYFTRQSHDRSSSDADN
jgi:hypothetical protein